MRSLWAHLLSWFLTGQFQGLTRNAAGDCALFLLPYNNKGQKKEENNALHKMREGNE